MPTAIEANHVTLEFDMNRGKVRSLKERLLQRDRIHRFRKILKAVNDISFTVEKGDIFGIIGANGAGKSTLLKILSGIMPPTSGSVRVDGLIAPMVELGTGFDFELSGIENIFLNGAVLGYDKAFISSRVADILSFAELWEFKDVPVKYYSTGMLTRLGFSVSTIISPDVLIVDEILSVGDAAFQEKSMKRMADMMKGGTTVVYVSHDIDSVRRLCGRVMWMEKGSCKRLGDAREVCQEYLDYMSDKA